MGNKTKVYAYTDTARLIRIYAALTDMDMATALHNLIHIALSTTAPDILTLQKDQPKTECRPN